MAYSGLFEIWTLELPLVSTDIFILLLDPHDYLTQFLVLTSIFFLSHNPVCSFFCNMLSFLT